MSSQAVSLFLKRIAEDRILQEHLVEFAAEHGHKFTINELRDQIAKLSLIVDLESGSEGAGEEVT